MDRFCKICLALIVLLLAINTFRPYFTQSVVHAQSKVQAPAAALPATCSSYTYIAYGIGRLEDLSTELGKSGGNGWRVVGVTTIGQYNNQVLTILCR